jgi:amino acid permease
MIFKKNNLMNQVDNLRPEELPVSPNSSTNETISLKSNHNKPEESSNTKISIGAEEEIEEIDTRTCFQKTFGKMGPGSMRGCIFNLCILSLGTGCLALPQKVGYMSMVATPIVIFVSGAINYWTLTILGDVARKHKLRKYEDAVTKLFNEKLSHFLGVVMVLNQCGMIILYQVIMYKLLGGVINEVFKLGFANVEDFVAESFWSHKKIKFLVCYSITILVLFPLCRLKTISRMRYASTFGIMSLFLLIFIVLVECPFFYKRNVTEGKQKINISDVSSGFGKDLQFFQSISTIIYAFACHVGVFPVLNSLHNPTRKRVQKVFRRATLLDIVCYLIIGFSGYLSQPENTPDLIVERDKIFKNDFLMTIGQLLFIFTLIAKICANYNGLRTTLLIFMNYDPIEYPNNVNFVMTVISLGTTTFIAVIFQKISDYISLIGSFCSVFVAVVMPGMIYIKDNDKKITSFTNMLAIVFVVVVSGFGLLTSYSTINCIIEHTK